MQLVFAVAHDDGGCRALGGGESLCRAVTVAALRHDGRDFWKARQNTGDGPLRHILRPVAVDGTDDLELRVLGDAGGDAGVDFIVHRNAREATDFEQVAALRHGLGEIVDLAFAHRLEIDGDAPCAGLRDDAVEGYDGDAGIAGFLYRAVKRGRRSGIDDDGVVTLKNEVLDLRGLFGRLVFGGGEGVGGSDLLVGNRLLGDLVPARQHRLTPGITGIIV